jgi:hypothetical protein
MLVFVLLKYFIILSTHLQSHIVIARMINILVKTVTYDVAVL